MEEVQVGFKLIKVNDNTEIESWRGVFGHCPSLPTCLFLPDNIQVHSPEIDTEYCGYKLIAWFETFETPSEA